MFPPEMSYRVVIIFSESVMLSYTILVILLLLIENTRHILSYLKYNHIIQIKTMSNRILIYISEYLEYELPNQLCTERKNTKH